MACVPDSVITLIHESAKCMVGRFDHRYVLMLRPISPSGALNFMTTLCAYKLTIISHICNITVIHPTHRQWNCHSSSPKWLLGTLSVVLNDFCGFHFPFSHKLVRRCFLARNVLPLHIRPHRPQKQFQPKLPLFGSTTKCWLSLEKSISIASNHKKFFGASTNIGLGLGESVDFLVKFRAEDVEETTSVTVWCLSLMR